MPSEDERRLLIIRRRRAAKAGQHSIQDLVRLAAPEPEVLRVIGEESQRNGTDTLSSCEIDQIIQATRAGKPKLARFR